MNDDTKVRTILPRLLALVLAIVLIIPAVLSVSAAEDTDKTITSTASLQPTDPSDTSDVDQEALKKELEAALKELKAYYAVELEITDIATPYRQDMLDALKKNTEAAETFNLYQDEYNLLEYKQRIDALLSDSDPVNSALKTSLDSKIALLQGQQASAIDELISELRYATVDLPIATAKVDELTAALLDFEIRLNLLTEEVLPNYPGYVEAQKQLAEIDAQIEQHINAASDTIRDLKAANSAFVKQETICTALNDYFGTEEVSSLAEDMRTLKADADVFAFALTLSTMEKQALDSNRVNKELSALKAEISYGNSQNKLFAYIGIGVGAAGVLMGILAMVFALRGRKEEDLIDMTQLASRADMEALDRQNRQLRDTLDHLDTRLSALGKEIDRIPTSPAATVQHKAPDETPEAPKAPVLEPPKAAPQFSQKVVAFLKLEYQPINPANSFLRVDPTGEYILYDDNTISLKPEALGKMNQMNGWRDRGLLHLFHAEINGQEYTENDLDAFRNGFYITKSVARRPSVSRNTANSYFLNAKGLIRMEKTL